MLPARPPSGSTCKTYGDYLFAALHFPNGIDTGEETVPSEEAFLVMLKRLAYPATLANLAWPCGRSPYAISRCVLRLQPRCSSLAGPGHQPRGQYTSHLLTSSPGSSTPRCATSMARSITCGMHGLWRLGPLTFNVLPPLFIEGAGVHAARADSTCPSRIAPSAVCRRLCVSEIF